MSAKSLLATCVATMLLAFPALAQDFPVTIEHKFGTTVIEAKPERVASVDHGGIGNLLALGVSPYLVHGFGSFAMAPPPSALRPPPLAGSRSLASRRAKPRTRNA